MGCAAENSVSDFAEYAHFVFSLCLMITRGKRIGFSCVPKQTLKSRQLCKADGLIGK
jgi:hypothetical protein